MNTLRIIDLVLKKADSNNYEMFLKYFNLKGVTVKSFDVQQEENKVDIKGILSNGIIFDFYYKNGLGVFKAVTKKRKELLIDSFRIKNNDTLVLNNFLISVLNFDF